MTSVELSAIKKNKKRHPFTGVVLNQRLKTHIPYATNDSIFKRSPLTPPCSLVCTFLA